MMWLYPHDLGNLLVYNEHPIKMDIKMDDLGVPPWLDGNLHD